MLRFRFTQPFLVKVPKFVVFNDYIKLDTSCIPEQTRDSITFKENEVKPVMKVEELIELSNIQTSPEMTPIIDAYIKQIEDKLKILQQKLQKK